MKIISFIRSNLKEEKSKRFSAFGKDVDTRLNNIHPLRFSNLVLRLISEKGLLTVDDMNQQMIAVNDEKNIDEVFSSAKERMTTEKKVSTKSAALSQAILSTLKSAFPNASIPKLDIVKSWDEMKSLINWNASSGFPKYVKKRYLEKEIKHIFDLFHSRKVDSLLRNTATVFSIFTKVQPKKDKYSTRLFFAPSYI